MAKPQGSAAGLIDWSRRDPWRERMGKLIEKHLRKACDLNDIDIHELSEVVGEAAMAAMDCAFEDACTVTWEDGGNLCADYLKRRGWKETAVNRAYIEALRGSVMSLHEVSDVRPGESFLARDLVLGGDPVRVTERTATKTLVAWDIIAARIVTVRGVVQMTGAVLPVDRDLAEDMLELFRRTRRRAPRMAAETFGAADPALRARLEAELASEDAVLHAAAATITTLWLNDTIRRCLAPLPQMANTDGEPLEFMTLHYRLEPEASPAGVAQALAGVPDLHAAEEGSRWTWFAPSKPRKGRKRKTEDDPNIGRTIHGEVVLEDRTLEVRVNSEARADRVRALLAPALAGLVREPLIERTTLEQAMAASPPAGIAAARASRASTQPICAGSPTKSWIASIARRSPIRCRCWAARVRARRCAVQRGGWLSQTGSRASSRTARAVRPATRCATTISAGCGTSSGSPICGGDRRKAGGESAVLYRPAQIRTVSPLRPAAL